MYATWVVECWEITLKLVLGDDEGFMKILAPARCGVPDMSVFPVLVMRGHQIGSEADSATTLLPQRAHQRLARGLHPHLHTFILIIYHYISKVLYNS